MRYINLFILIINILANVFLCFGQNSDISEIMTKAEKNIDKYRKGKATIIFQTKKGVPVKEAEVKIEQTTQDFLFGNIIFPVVGVLGKFEDIDVYRPKVFKKRFKDLFNMAIFPFYWSGYEEKIGKEKWASIEPILEWCELNNITAKGHPLAWVESSGTPEWLYDLPVEVTEDLLKARIFRLVRGFDSRIDIWDVVNEPTHTISWKNVMKAPHGERYISVPIEKIVPWIEKCYRWAHEANPGAELVINDYETIVPKWTRDTRERFYKLVNELKSRDVPLSGIGLQAHVPRSEWYSPQEYWEVLDFYAELGYPIHLTEFVAESSGEPITGWKKGKWTPEAQAEYAEQFYRLSFGHPMVESINWWGLSDRYIWRERPQAGLLDKNYNPKPVYNRLKKLIKNEWMTKTTARTDKNGKINFRGFYGDYKIIIKDEKGFERTFVIHLNKNEVNRWNFTL